MYKNLLRPILFLCDPEQIHHFSTSLLRTFSKCPYGMNVLRSVCEFSSERLSQEIFGVRFLNPLGLAGGFDKNALLIEQIHSLGFGFTEVGSVSFESSSGNQKPRLFRLPQDEALINRMGLNNDGAHVVAERLMRAHRPYPVGVNIVKTHNPLILGEKGILDFKNSFNVLKDIGDYCVLNISCPNTEEGKTFEEKESLKALLDSLLGEKYKKPVCIKISPDLTEENIYSLLEVTESFNIDGYIATNTSSKRDNLSSDKGMLDEIGRGGLSGKPLFDKSLSIVKILRKYLGNKKTIIGCGGIRTSEDALLMFRAGASLIQSYTGFVYEGPRFAFNLLKGVDQYLEREGVKNISEIVGE